MKRLLLTLSITLITALLAQADPGVVFPTPEAAKSALLSAIRAKSKNALINILGTGAEDIVNSGDPVYDNFLLGKMAAEAAEQCSIDQFYEDTIFFEIGPEAWQLPIPLVKRDGGWVFNPGYEKGQVLQNRFKRNQDSAIVVCRTYVNAQYAYAQQDRNKNGVEDFAQNIISTPGTHDGLFWEQASPAESVSPLWPLVERARHEGYAENQPKAPMPYRGYFFRILTAQGANAPGGAKDYIQDGKMIGGFALIAWPAKWGVSGKETYVVNQLGKIWQKDLGSQTTEVVRQITTFNPDSSWQPGPQ